ncbi:hypothetical protein Tco_0438891 [Tanacetum coccineum]
MAWFKELKIHLEFLHNNRLSVGRNMRPYEIAFQVFFKEEYETFRVKMYHLLNQLQWQLERENLHSSNPKSCLNVLRTSFKKFFDSKERRNLLRYLNELDKLIDESVLKYRELRMKESEVQAIKEIEKQLKEREIQQQESLITNSKALDVSLVTEGTTLEANLSTGGITLEACLITEGIVMEACLVIEGATLEACLVNESIEMDDSLVAKESTDNSVTSSELDESSSSRNEYSKSGNKNISSDHESTSSRNDADVDIGPSYDSDIVSEVHLDMFKNVFAHGIQNHEQPESIPDTYVVNENNSDIISDIPNMDQINREAQQANVLLTKELERYKEKEKHFAKETTIEYEYYKKIKLLNDEISNLKSQACQKDKTFASENEKYDEYVQPLLKRKNELEKKNQEFLKQINNLDNRLRKAGQTDHTLRIKAKELVPSLYNIDEMGNDLLSDHKIISEEELKCKAEKRLKVLSNKSDEAKIKFDTEDLETINIELEYSIQDSNAEKGYFLKQIASLESKLASQDTLSIQKEYSDLRTSYNALKAKFDSLNQDKGKSLVSNFSTPKVSVPPKIYTGESSKSFPKRVSQFTTYSLQKDRKFSKKPQVCETPTSQKVFNSSDSSKKKKISKTPKSRLTPVKQVWRPK